LSRGAAKAAGKQACPEIAHTNVEQKSPGAAQAAKEQILPGAIEAGVYIDACVQGLQKSCRKDMSTVQGQQKLQLNRRHAQ
jgi:hypothetical protein